MPRILIAAICLIASGCLPTARAADSLQISGRVIDADGKPAAGSDVATYWMIGRGKIRPFDAARTAADGSFTLKVPFVYGRWQPLMAMDPTRARGGSILLDNRVQPGPVTIRLGPLVRVHGHYARNGDGGRPSWMNTYFNLGTGKAPTPGLLKSILPGPVRLAGVMSRDGSFSVDLPPGLYEMHGYGTNVEDHVRWLTLSADRPDLDLGTIALKVRPIDSRYGKIPPPLSIAGAKGVPADVKLADYRGKWVVLECWATWCGPCVSRGLPDWIAFADEFKSRRDDFVILTIHDKTATSIDDLETKMAPLVNSAWKGKPLPFPILLDDRGKTFEAFGVDGIPADFLIDPGGRLVDTERGALAALRAIFEPTQKAESVARALDADVHLHLEQTALGEAVEYFAAIAQVKIRIDPDGLRAAGVTEETAVPVTLAGLLSLRSWLDLSLPPLGLEYQAGPGGLIITRRVGEAREDEPSERQRRAALALESVLAGRTPVEVDGKTLANVVIALREATAKPFLLDPASLRSGAIRVEAITGPAPADRPLGETLSAALRPLGLVYQVRDEAVILVPTLAGGPPTGGR